MIPHELTSRTLELPSTDDPSIVVISGTAPRHLRFAYRLQDEFGDHVKAWFQNPDKSIFSARYGLGDRIRGFRKRAGEKLPSDIKRFGFHHYLKTCGVRHSVAGLARFLWDVAYLGYLTKRFRKRLLACERRMFSAEIEDLKQDAKLKPVPVEDPNAPEFVSAVREESPYLLLTLGGPLYRRPLLESPRGLPINQHAGWSPDLKGARSLEWALYHRDLWRAGCTVHVTSTGADAGPILRRSHPCFVSSDTPESCLARTVALGTELMIEVVHEILATGRVRAYEQPRGAGVTYLISHATTDLFTSLYRDFARGWLPRELRRLRTL